MARFYAAEVTVAFEYLHARHIAYRDLKPENLLIDAKGHIKITDFGFAKQIKEDQTWTLCGTPEYLAPEIIKAKGYGKSVDWWALGILIFEMIAGFPPFSDDDNIKLFEKIIACKLRFPEGFEKKAKDLCKCLITPDLSKRYGNLKRGAEDVKAHAWFDTIDWDQLIQLGIPAPYIPTVSGESDTSNFETYDEDYTAYGGAGHDAYKDKFDVRNRQRIPSDPLNESIYNMVLRPQQQGGNRGISTQDRPSPLYKSKFASHVRAEHLAARRTMSNPTYSAGPVGESYQDAVARGSLGGVDGSKTGVVSGLVRGGKVKGGGAGKTVAIRVSSQGIERDSIARAAGASNLPTDPSTRILAPKPVTKPISKPTSGRIALAAERRSNASTPVVADPCAWDHLAADAAEEPFLKSRILQQQQQQQQQQQKSKLALGQESNEQDKEVEVPEELIDHWEPFAADADEAVAVRRRSSPPPTEMSSLGGVSTRKNASINKKNGAGAGGKVFHANHNGNGGIGGGNKRRMLPEAERIAVLAGLKSNYHSLQAIYNRLPVAMDSISKINRKTSIEKQLSLLEEDIKKFSHPNIIIDEGN
ncbi:camp-dependent protein kinase catalytic subunit [Chytriomyces hyalinus]|nr:camp-dependent protein kinase catalytic subunit [Chytriomyces hyalinus]